MAQWGFSSKKFHHSESTRRIYFSSVFTNNQDGDIGMPLGLCDIRAKVQLMGLLNQLLQLLGSCLENLVARRKTNSADGQLF